MKEEDFSASLMSRNGALLKAAANMSFSKAFAWAREIGGDDDLFIWNGKVYSTKGGDMAPAPAANMEDNIYAKPNQEPNTEQNTETGIPASEDTQKSESNEKQVTQETV